MSTYLGHVHVAGVCIGWLSNGRANMKANAEKSPQATNKRICPSAGPPNPSINKHPDRRATSNVQLRSAVTGTSWGFIWLRQIVLVDGETRWRVNVPAYLRSLSLLNRCPPPRVCCFRVLGKVTQAIIGTSGMDTFLLPHGQTSATGFRAFRTRMTFRNVCMCYGVLCELTRKITRENYGCSNDCDE